MPNFSEIEGREYPTIILGGDRFLGLFGIMGIFIGPILLPLLIIYLETFKERFN
jgi:predicted PurR-regulated permease PerM